MSSTITIQPSLFPPPPPKATASTNNKFFCISKRGRLVTIIIMFHLIFKIFKLWSIETFIMSNYEYTTTKEQQLSLPSPSALSQDNEDLLSSNNGSSYLELLSTTTGRRHQQQQGSTKRMGEGRRWMTKQQHNNDDYCHPITNTTKIINNSYHDDILDFKGCRTFYPLSELIKNQNSKPLSAAGFKKWKKLKKTLLVKGGGDYSGDRPRSRPRRRPRHTTKAICRFNGKKDYWYEMPHAMQQLHPCFSFWMSHVDAYNKKNNNTYYYDDDDDDDDDVNIDRNDDEDLKLILIWNSTHEPMDLRKVPVEKIDLRFVHAILEIFRTVFHVEQYNTTDHMHLEYYSKNYYQNNNNKKTEKEEDTTNIVVDTDIYAQMKFSVEIHLGEQAGYRMLNSDHAERLRKMTAKYYPHIFTSTSLSEDSATASAAAAAATTASADAADTVTANKTMATDIVVAAAGCPPRRSHHGVDKDDDDDHHHHPVIGILNRAPGPVMGLRTINNVNLLQEMLQQEFSSSSSSSIAPGGGRGAAIATIHPIQYFENATVWEQLAWFHNVDIVISPHGAQLTGLPFVPKCGGLLEYFPTNYYLPYYFGSLASISGLHYIHMYLGQNLTSEWYYGAQNDTEWQTYARTNTSLCVPIPETIEAVRTLITNWHTCCSKQ